MAKKAYCASCGREVWLGRDGGCQHGHPASDLSGIREVDPSAAKTVSPARRPVIAAPEPVAVTPAAAPGADAGWGNSPDVVTGGRAGGEFDYTALPSDVTIGDTDCLVRRSAARIVDKLLAGFVGGAIGYPYVAAQLAALRAHQRPAVSATPYLIGTAVSLAYFILLPLVWRGRTVGKAAFGIAVTDLRGQPPSLGKLVLRELAMFIDGFFYGILGLSIASKSPRAQRIGDVWAETVVVRTR